MLRDTPDLAAALATLGLDPGVGLEASDARDRWQAPPKTRGTASLWVLAARQAADPMVVILVAAAVVALLLGEVVDAGAIFVIVFLNGCFGAFQEFRADRALEKLREVVPASARVRRGGETLEVGADEVVEGDVVLVSAGDRIPADLRWLETSELHADESLLSGESLPVAKQAGERVDAELPLADRQDLGFAGTLVTRGRGEGVAFAVGDDTAAGSIAKLLQSGTAGATPLHLSLARLGRALAAAVILIAVLVFALGVLRGEPVSLMILVAVSLAVAALPEALPAVVTAALALGSQRMVRGHALVRRLAAAEALGSVSVIAADKTGTLTLNQMTVDRVWLGEEWAHADAQRVARARPQLLEAMLLNNDSQRADRDWLGDPTETALARFAEAGGVERESLPARVVELPFDSERKRMTTVHETDDGLLVVMKGSPEVVVTSIASDAATRATILQAAESAASDGYRLLALASKLAPRETLSAIDPDDEGSFDEVESGLELLALVALMDPPRPGVAEAIQACRDAGIRTLMITGDHPETALAMSRILGLGDRDRGAVTGAELEDLAGESLRREVASKVVFARVAPEHKVKILDALQSDGALVAMTGDGVNDAPALRRANVGVAMGMRGTDVAREAADMVLLDDNFTTIVSAIEEGRRIFDNIQRFIRYTLTSNLGEILVMVVAPLAGLPLPLAPVQILWINLVTGWPARSRPRRRAGVGRDDEAAAAGQRRSGAQPVRHPPHPRRRHLDRRPLPGRADRRAAPGSRALADDGLLRPDLRTAVPGMGPAGAQTGRRQPSRLAAPRFPADRGPAAAGDGLRALPPAGPFTPRP